MLGIPVVAGKNGDDILVFIRREWKKYPGGGMGFRSPGLGALPPHPPGAGGPDQPLGEPACVSTALLRRQDFKCVPLASWEPAP